MLNQKITIVIKMEHQADEIILKILNQLCKYDILNARQINLQCYRCSFSCEPLIQMVVAFFNKDFYRCTIPNEEIFRIARNISNFDFTINDNYAIKWIFKAGYLEHAKFLIHQGDIHANDDFALRIASYRGHLDVLKYLIDHGANIHALDDCALQLASRMGHIDIVRYLIDKNANIHANNNGALRSASMLGHSKVVHFLLEKGADIHACNDFSGVIILPMLPSAFDN